MRPGDFALLPRAVTDGLCARSEVSKIFGIFRGAAAAAAAPAVPLPGPLIGESASSNISLSASASKESINALYGSEDEVLLIVVP